MKRPPLSALSSVTLLSISAFSSLVKQILKTSRKVKPSKVRLYLLFSLNHIQ